MWRLSCFYNGFRRDREINTTVSAGSIWKMWLLFSTVSMGDLRGGLFILKDECLEERWKLRHSISLEFQLAHLFPNVLPLSCSPTHDTVAPEGSNPPSASYSCPISFPFSCKWQTKATTQPRPSAWTLHPPPPSYLHPHPQGQSSDHQPCVRPALLSRGASLHYGEELSNCVDPTAGLLRERAGLSLDMGIMQWPGFRGHFPHCLKSISRNASLVDSPPAPLRAHSQPHQTSVCRASRFFSTVHALKCSRRFTCTPAPTCGAWLLVTLTSSHHGHFIFCILQIQIRGFMASFYCFYAVVLRFVLMNLELQHRKQQPLHQYGRAAPSKHTGHPISSLTQDNGSVLLKGVIRHFWWWFKTIQTLSGVCVCVLI